MDALKGLYHADKLDEKPFVANFTIRLKEFKQIIDNLNRQKKKPLQHFLITGKRGMGKSTLLRRIHIEASKPPLNEKMIAVRLGAEQYRLSRLFKLWEVVIEHLANNAPELLQRKTDAEKNKNYEESLLPIIIDHVAKSNKTLLLLIDNFDQFVEKISSKDQHALREALMLHPIQIIGNTVFYNEYFARYNNPFFDFFKPINLENLDKNESEEFLKLRAASEGIDNFEEIFKQQKGKITALRILSGGVPRTLLILLSIVSKRNTGDAVDHLNEMLEQATPLYQDRMQALSPQQQEIMHHLAMHWDRTPVKELSSEMRIPSKSISAQLLQLEKSGYIKKLSLSGRNQYYEIDERFFNIWLLMSEAAPYDAKRVIWLTKWLDAFYTKEELKEFADFCLDELKQINPGNRFLIAQAISESQLLDIGDKRKLISETLNDLKDKLSEVKVWADVQKEKMDIQVLENLTQIFNKLWPKEKARAHAMCTLAIFYFLENNQGQKGKAYQLLQQATILFDNVDNLSLIYQILILLWNEKISEACQAMVDLLNGPLNNENNIGSLSMGLQYFLVFRQKHFLHKLFSSNPELRDRYKPIYYALMHQMQNEFPKEYLKMPAELDEPVKRILELVTEEQERLGV